MINNIIGSKVVNTLGETFEIVSYNWKENINDSLIILNNGKKYSIGKTYSNHFFQYEKEVASQIEMELKESMGNDANDVKDNSNGSKIHFSILTELEKTNELEPLRKATYDEVILAVKEMRTKVPDILNYILEDLLASIYIYSTGLFDGEKHNDEETGKRFGMSPNAVSWMNQESYDRIKEIGIFTYKSIVKFGEKMIGDACKKLRELSKSGDFICEQWKIKFLLDFPEEWRADKDFMLLAMYYNHSTFQYASNILISDRTFVKNATCVYYNKQKYISFLTFIPDVLKDDYELMSELVKFNGLALQFASERIKSDITIVKEAISNAGIALAYACDELKHNRDIVLQAIKNDGIALAYACDELKHNRDIVLQAIRNDGRAIGFTSDELKNSYELALEAVKNNGYALEVIPLELRENRTIVLEALKCRNNRYYYKLCNRNIPVYSMVAKKFAMDREIIIEGVKENGGAFTMLPECFKNDKNIILLAAKTYPQVLCFISDIKILKDKAFIEQVENAMKKD